MSDVRLDPEPWPVVAALRNEQGETIAWEIQQHGKGVLRITTDHLPATQMHRDDAELADLAWHDYANDQKWTNPLEPLPPRGEVFRAGFAAALRTIAAFGGLKQ